mgnify:CR=1 FL=1|tara:strand:+ start:3780 stop:3908 length:129 start_codon:yes stop_codon:yes gene_type:complete
MKLRKIKYLGEGMILVIDEYRIKRVISTQQWEDYIFTNHPEL